MAIDTFSSFYYLPSEINSTNQNLNFDEGAGELTAVIAVGAYSLTEFALAIKIALDSAGTQEYTVGFNRLTRKFTISAASSFDLLIATGTQLGTSPFEIMGFTGADLTGGTSYTGNIESGNAYYPQFKLQDYVAPGFNKERIEPSVNESASGVLEVLTFGTRSLMKFRIPFITNNVTVADCNYILADANGVENTLDFLDFLITKNKVEFNPDRDATDFNTVILEKTSSSGKGTGYLLRERVDENLRDIYDSGLLTFRVVG